MRITAVEALVLRAPSSGQVGADFTNEALVLRIRTSEGLSGLAECNHPPEVVRMLLHARGSSTWSVGIEETLLGRDPCDLEQITTSLYRGTALSARRGLGLGLLHAIDVALWDLRAQAHSQPLWQMLWGEQAIDPLPYATIYTGPGDFDDSLFRLGTMLERLHGLGYRGVKIEPLEDCVPLERIEEFVAAARTAVGERVELLLDFGHRFQTAEEAASCIERLTWARPHLVETPLWVDDLPEYGRLQEFTDVPIAASELYESPWEFYSLLHVGKVDVVQPWPNRVGVSGTLRVAAEAASAGRRCVLAGWNATAIGTALAVNLAAGLGAELVLEHPPAQVYEGFPLRLVGTPEPHLKDGRFALPQAPGIGVSLDEDLINYYTV